MATDAQIKKLYEEDVVTYFSLYKKELFSEINYNGDTFCVYSHYPTNMSYYECTCGRSDCVHQRIVFYKYNIESFPKDKKFESGSITEFGYYFLIKIKLNSNQDLVKNVELRNTVIEYIDYILLKEKNKELAISEKLKRKLGKNTDFVYSDAKDKESENNKYFNACETLFVSSKVFTPQNQKVFFDILLSMDLNNKFYIDYLLNEYHARSHGYSWNYDRDYGWIDNLVFQLLSNLKNKEKALSIACETFILKNRASLLFSKEIISLYGYDKICQGIIEASIKLDKFYFFSDNLKDKLDFFINYTYSKNLYPKHQKIFYYFKTLDINSFIDFDNMHNGNIEDDLLRFVLDKATDLSKVLILKKRYNFDFRVSQFLGSANFMKNLDLCNEINPKDTLRYLSNIFEEYINYIPSNREYYNLDFLDYNINDLCDALLKIGYNFKFKPGDNLKKLYTIIKVSKYNMGYCFNYKDKKLPFKIDSTTSKKYKGNYFVYLIIDKETLKEQVLVNNGDDYFIFDYENGEIINLNCNVSETHNIVNCPELRDFLAYNNTCTTDEVLNIQYESIVKKHSKTKKEIKEKEEKEETKKLFRQLINNVNIIKPTIEDKASVQMHIDFSINVEADIFECDYADFSLKVGLSKYFVIKNHYDFFDNVMKARDISYGKTLTFNHGLQNFTPSSQNIIKSLIEYCLISETKGLSLLFPVAFLFKFLCEYKDVEWVLENDKNIIEGFKVNPIELEPDLFINEEGNLSTSLIKDTKHWYFYDSLNTMFLLDFNNKEFLKLKFKDDKSKNIHKFLLLNPKFSTKHIVDDVVDKILPVIIDDVYVNPVFKSKHPIKEFEIESYLDLNDKKEIEIKTLLFSDGIEINNPINEHQKAKYIRYNSILEQFGFEKNKIKDSDLVGKFLVYDLSELKKISKVFVSESIQDRKITKFPKIKTYVSISGGLITSHIVNSQFSDSELGDILEAVKKKKKFILLKNNVISLEGDPNITAFSNYVEEFNLDSKKLSKPQPSPIYNLFNIENFDSNDIEVSMSDILKTVLTDIKNYKTANIPISANYSEILRPYQREGYNWLSILCKYNLGGILADDMGLGKTIQAICLIEKLEEDLPILIVCPRSLIYNWKKEFEKFNSHVKCSVIDGLKATREDIESTIVAKKEVFVISFESARSDSDILEQKLFNLIILDEAQNIKNINAQKTKSIKTLKANKRLVLTGTPIENAISDLWSIFDFLMPNYLGSYDKFKQIERQALIGDKKSLDYIIKKTSPFILRRIKRDVLKELPEKIEDVIYTSFKEDHRLIYNRELTQAKKMLKDPKLSTIAILAEIMKLRQICISPKMIDPDCEVESQKIEQIMDLINEAITNNHKVLLFSSFVKGLDLIATELNKQETPFYKLTGITPAIERLNMAESFNGSSDEKIFLISLKAGGTGLNLTGADIVIHLDPWWNIAAENQASDRAHRIGQTKTVHVYKIVLIDSIEEKVIALQLKKKELSDAIIKEGGEEISNLSIDDYSFLLEN